MQNPLHISRADGASADRFPSGSTIVILLALAKVLFHDYFFPFEVTSVLLIVAAIAAIVMAGRMARGEPSDPIAEEQLELEAGGRPPELPRVEEPERVP